MSKRKRLAIHNAKRGVRPDKMCLACQKIESADSGEITRHHLVPRASKDALKGRHDTKTISLCVPCHRLVHDVWGEGHSFMGPITEADLVAWIVSELSVKA